jgi:hypothetical protein
VVLTHGEDGARAALADAIAERYGITAERPQLDDIIVLFKGSDTVKSDQGV